MRSLREPIDDAQPASMFELCYDGLELTEYLAVEFEGDATRSRHFYNQDDAENAGSDTLLFLPNGRREVGLIIGGDEDGTLNDEEFGVIVDPQEDTHPGVLFTLVQSAMGDPSVYVTPDPFSTIRTPDSYGDGTGLEATGYYELAEMTTRLGRTPRIITDEYVPTAPPPEETPGELDKAPPELSLCGVGICCFANDNPSRTTTPRGATEPSLGGAYDMIGGNGRDLPPGIVFSGDLQFPEIDEPVAPTEGGPDSHQEMRELMEHADEDLGINLRAALAKRYPWMTADELDAEFEYRRALSKAMASIPHSCFAGSNQLPEDYWEPLSWEGSDGTREIDRNRWRVKEGVSAADAARALKEAVNSGTVAADCTMGVWLAAVLAGLEVADSDEAFNEWMRRRYIGGWKKSGPEGWNSINYESYGKNTEHIEGDWVYYPNDRRYIKRHPDGAFQGDSGIAVKTGKDGKRRYRVHGLEGEQTEQEIKDSLRRAFGEEEDLPDDYHQPEPRGPRRITGPGGRREPSPLREIKWQ